MIDTAGTMCEVIDRIYSHRPHSINIVASHGLFNGSALEKLSVYKEQ
jgi:phosphoribosylpyrophosphate synthetase